MLTRYSLMLTIVIILTHCKINSAQNDTSTPKPNSPVTDQNRDPVTSNITNARRMGSKYEGRIIRGYHCSTKDHGFMALLAEELDGQWERICGCSIIAPNWILTAAHCIRNPRFSYGVIVAVNTNPELILTTQKMVHPDFNPETFSNDIALLKLANSVSDIKFVKLPKAQAASTDELKPICNRALVVGWGLTESNSPAELHDLQCAEIPMLSSQECAFKFKKYHQLKLPPNQICTLSTEGVDACQGDSGGPLLCGATQIGIVSWGISCAEPTNPGVYTDIAKYVNFIDKFIKDAEARDASGPLNSVSTLHVNFICMLIIVNII